MAVYYYCCEYAYRHIIVIEEHTTDDLFYLPINFSLIVN